MYIVLVLFVYMFKLVYLCSVCHMAFEILSQLGIREGTVGQHLATTGREKCVLTDRLASGC